MTPEAKDILLQVLRTKGESLLTEPGQCRALLNDFAKGNHKREIRCLVTALEIGCVQRLQAEPGGGSHLLRRQMVEKLHSECGIAEDLGFWVVESWAEALCWLGENKFAPLTESSRKSSTSVAAAVFQLGHRLQAILKSENLSHLEPIFAEHAIADSVIETLSDSDLRNLGVTQLGARRQLLAAFAGTQQPLSTPHPSVANVQSHVTATKLSPFENTLGMKFVPVPGTNVLFSIWETRVKDYAAFSLATGKRVKEPRYIRTFTQTSDDPVMSVSWNDAKAFCKWLTNKEVQEGIIGPQQSYRLPTDEEWSLAVWLPAPEVGSTPSEKSGGIWVYPWGGGEQWPPPKGTWKERISVLCTNLIRYWCEQLFGTHISVLCTYLFRVLCKTLFGGHSSAWGRMQDTLGPLAEQNGDLPAGNYATRLGVDSFEYTSPVGTFAPNRYGLFDMGGNVWEWCDDWYDETQKTRVLRGASFSSSDRESLLSSYRYGADPDSGSGFRCVLTGEVAP